MYRIDRNNFHTKPKNSTIYTPKEVSEFIFNMKAISSDKLFLIEKIENYLQENGYQAFSKPDFLLGKHLEIQN
jgi:hypothetical protein